MQLQVRKAILVSFFLATLALSVSPRLSRAQAWTPPQDNNNQAAGDLLKLPEVAKMPDVVGVRLGMSPVEALQTLHKQYPTDRYQEMKVTWWPSAQKPDYGFNILSPDPSGTPDAYISFTAPPSRQVVWRLVRYTRKVNVNRATLLAALRQKYGKESLAAAEGGLLVGDDASIGQLVWLFDEHGGRAPAPAPQAFGGGTAMACASMNGSYQPIMPRNDEEAHTYFRDVCTSFVVLRISIGSTEIVTNTITEFFDAPLAVRTAHASEMWQRNAAERARQEELERSKKVKPSL